MIKILPKHSKTITKTNRNKVQVENDTYGGSYWHYGLEKALVNCLEKTDYVPVVHLNINIDGLPLFKSSRREVWPILFNIHEKKYIQPMVVGIYSGKGKPKDMDWFLSPFVNEFLTISEKCGIDINGKRTEVRIRCFVCDTPARADCKGKHRSYPSLSEQ